ncbi:MAG: hypothetical protein AAFQ64_02565 [Pseudomonadota bacterium]
MALQIVLHTFRMIFGNIGQALRVSVVPNLILIVATFFAIGSLGLGVYGGAGAAPTAVPTGFGILMSLLLLPLSLFIFAWIAVGWHRFILLEEYAGIVPALAGRPIWPYVWKSILLALTMMVIVLPIMLVFGGIIGATAADSVADGAVIATDGWDASGGAGFGAMLLFSLIAIPVSYVAMRWGVALVSTALGQQMGFFEAWGKTKPVALIALGVVVILMAINLLLQSIVTVLSPLPLISDLIGIATSWLTMMLSISILTTIYGHVIEGRPLVS